MAKSTRSKWKKLHRRQRAEAEREHTAERLRKLHHKLVLTAKGGISAIPPQDPETRFHFLNPELDPRVPNTSAHLNTNYRMDPNAGKEDFSKPLRLPPPRTCFYGKSNPNGPHPQAVNFEVIDADAPIGGHALTKADVERMLAKRQNDDAAQKKGGPSEGIPDAREENEEAELDSASDAPEEYVFEFEKPTWRKADSKKQKGKEKKGTKGTTADGELAVAEDLARVEAEEGRTAARIKSMEAPQKRKGAVVATGGSSKVKKISSNKSVETRRIVSSGSKAAKKLAKPPRKGGKTVVL
ncbi:unnamed protein product [Phytomonas sp. EM1]|nr:unnamed protein product [Phytomonas sp. EM1]|eukprot:CCW64841.1 unnamed protein product [Phytomonas sp. isolate EM1]